MNKEQQRKSKMIQLALKGGTDKELLILDEIHALEDKIDAEIPALKNLLPRIKGDKGDKGDKPIAGKDYQIPKDGKPGKNYILTSKDKKEIASAIKVPVIEKVIEKIEIIKEQPVITQEIKEVAIAETSVQIRDKLEILQGDERLDSKSIKGLDNFVDKLILDRAIEILDKRTQYLLNKTTITTVAHDSTLSGDGSPSNPLKVIGGGGSSTGSIITATDNGDNKNYTLAQAATSATFYVVVNNGFYTTDDPSFGFSVSGTTLTFTTALPSDLANTIIKLVCL